MIYIFLEDKDNKDQIIQDFKELMFQIDENTPDEINNRLADIIARVRRLYPVNRDD